MQIFKFLSTKMKCSTIVSISFLSLVFYLSQANVITVDCHYGNDTICKSNILIPCKTLHTALELAETMRNNTTTIQINSGNYSYNITSSRTLSFSNVTITGNGSNVTIVECNNSGTGFGFINVNNTSISKLTLSGCGQLRNSTTMNTSNSVMLFRAALYFVNVVNVIIDNVVVSDSIGMGVAMYDVTGDVTVTNSIFRNNKVPSHELEQYPGGGGFSVEFSYCKPGSNYIPCTYNNYNNKSSYLFYNCTFNHNTASTLNSYHTSYPNETFGTGNQQFGRGGGLSVFFKGHSIQNRIKVCNCIFDHNYAVWGGGYHSDIVDYSTGNVLTLENCEFTNNHCYYNNTVITTGTGGGGARIAFLFYDPRSKVNNNSVQFINCTFQFNTAYYGGGLSCRISKEHNETIASNSLELVNCTWAENVARTGSGVDIISHAFPHGVSPVVTIVNCNFTANNNSYSKTPKFFSLGIGALYADDVPLKFSGNCIFTRNNDSAIAGIATHFMFSNNTSVMFINNSGWHGAGMALLGNAYFIVYHNTSFKFINNSAVTKGGAIYYINSGQKDFLSTQRCLLYYYDIRVGPPSWATKFIFSGNRAPYGRSIYCTTLLTCIWNNIPGNVTVGGRGIEQVFNLSKIFYYEDKHDEMSEEIATDAVNISFDSTERIRIPPGQFYRLNIRPVDDRNQISHPAIIVNTDNSSISKVDLITNKTDYYVILHGIISSNISLTLYTVNNRPYVRIIDVTIDECPPGFHPSHKSKSGNENICKCSTGTSRELYGINGCDNELLVARLDAQFWAGYVAFNGTKILMTSDCPQGYCSDTRVNLPNSLLTPFEKLVCSNKRNGRLCGSCQHGYYVYVNSQAYQCGQCNDTLSNHGTLILIISKYVPLTVMMGFIIFFDISLVDGPLNSFILFSQIFVTLPLYDEIGLATEGRQIASNLTKIADFMYNLWYLRYFEYSLDKFCTFKFDSTLPVLVEEYIPAFYVLFLCVIFFIVIPLVYNCFARCRVQAIQRCALRLERMCIRFRYHWSVRNSVIHSLTTFLVLSYARITLVTFKLLTPTTLYGPGGQDSSQQKTVVWFDGTKSYFGSEHLPYALGALLVLVTFVIIPPLLLLSYPLLPVLLTRLGVEEYWIVKKLIINPLSKCVPIFDAFQSCYKDEYRFFAGLLFIYRVLALAVLAFTPTTVLNLAWIQGFLLITLLLHCTFQPYKKRWHNFIEGMIFIILSSINIITFYRLFQAQTTNTKTNISFWMQIILIYCPLVYFVVYTSAKVFVWLRPRIVMIKDKLRGNNNINPMDVANLFNSREFPGRMENEDENYATSSESTDESVVADDDNQQQQQQDDNNNDDNDDDVEMIYPVDWNDADDNRSNIIASPYGKTYITL